MKQRVSSKLLTICLLIFSVFNAEAQNVETKIQSVTVYRKGAMVERTGTINLKKGSNTLYLNNLSTELDPNTLIIGINNKDVNILSVKHEIEVVDNEDAKKNNFSKDKRIAVLKDSLTTLKYQLSVLSDEEALIHANQKIGGEQNGVPTAELIAMTEFYKKELTEIGRKKMAANKKINSYKDEILRLMQEKQNSLTNLQKKDSRVKLVISSPANIATKINLSYLVFSASWEPFYEIRVNDIHSPLNMVYGAHIKQSTTEDWNQVQMTVSTGDPSVGNDAPEFYPMYLPPSREYRPTKKWAPPTSNNVYGIVLEQGSLEPLIGVTVVEEGTQNGTITDIDGKFKLTMKNTNNMLSISYIGFITQKVKPGEDMQIVLEEDNRQLEEVVVVGYGTARDDYDDDAFFKSVQSQPREIKYNEPDKNIPLELNDTQTATEFKIEMPYTVPCDDKVYDISMLTYKIPTDYRYTSLPRWSKDVFLLADLKDFSQYPILKGNAYVYLENVYQGECTIAPDFAADTFSISVGRDKDIAINRQEVKDFTSKKIIGSTVKVQKCFEITIKNNKNSDAVVTVTDQYPLPKYSDIKVTLTESNGAKVDPERGKLTWTVSLDSKEKKVLRFSYEVKYPKSYNFSVE